MRGGKSSGPLLVLSNMASWNVDVVKTKDSHILISLSKEWFLPSPTLAGQASAQLVPGSLVFCAAY